MTPGENRFGFRAFDTDGKAASVDGVILYTPNPVTLNGCADIEKRIEYGQTEAPADFTVIANDGCGGAQVFCSHESGSLFPLGTSQVTCGASDTCGSSAECSFKVNVVAGAAPTATATSTSIATATPTSPATATPTPVNTLTPEPRPASQPVSCASDQVRVQVTCGIATPVLLWSPNHKFEDVGHTAAASASCEGAEPASPPAASLTGTTVWADEPEVSVPGDGSGNFAPDTRISGSIISVRSERRGTEDGRVYLLISHGSDGVGHESRACCTVVVPHSKSSASIALVNAQAAAARATCEQTGAAPSGFFQHGLSRSINRSGNESETSSGVDAKDRNQKGVKKPGKRDRRLI